MLASLLPLLACVDVVDVGVENTDDVPAWVQHDDEGASVGYWEAWQGYENPTWLEQYRRGLITPTEAEMAGTRQLLAGERLRLEVLRGPNGPALMAHERQYIANRSGRPPIHPWFYSVPEAIVQSQTLIEGYIRQIEHYIEGKPQRWWAMWDEEEGRVMRGTGSPPWDTLEQASDTAAPLAFSSDSCSEGPIKVSAERLGVSYEDAGRGAVTISGTGRPTSITITSPIW